MASSTKPTIVLVPGAWHSPMHYTELIGLLKDAGYNDIISEKNPSCDSETPNDQSASGDTAAIRESLLTQINAGKDVLLVMHSYGGSPGAAAATGLSKPELSATGKQGGIIGLVFIAAFLAQEGDSLLNRLPGRQFDPWVIQHNETGQLSVDNPKSVFYADVPSPQDELAISQLKHQSKNSLSTPSGSPAWAEPAFKGRRSYFQTLNDNGIPSIAQQMMLQGSGVEWADIKQFNSSHSPFLSHPKELSAWIVEQAQAFAQA